MPQATAKQRVKNTTTYTRHIGRAICKRLIKGDSLRKICREPQFPPLQTVTSWLINFKHPEFDEFRTWYHEARKAQAELRVDEIFEIVDDGTDDWIPTYDKNNVQNGWKPDREAIQRARLRVDTRKWFAAKMLPRLYGENINVEHGVTGDLAKLLDGASNNSTGLPSAPSPKLIESK